MAQEKCESDAVPLPGSDLIKTLEAVSNCLYKDVATLKVKQDGEGKLSIFYENGKPMLLKLFYKNDKGTMIKEISFADLEKGKQLVFENPDKPGKAMIFQKGKNFQKDGKYNFKLSVRTSLKPVEHNDYEIAFNGDEKNPSITKGGNAFNNIIVTPGVSWLKWTGTFTKVEFK